MSGLLLWKMEIEVGEKGCIREVEEPRGVVAHGVVRPRMGGNNGSVGGELGHGGNGLGQPWW